jgi:hypothetical protein
MVQFRALIRQVAENPAGRWDNPNWRMKAIS